MSITPKLTTVAACRVAGINRITFNEHVSAGRFPCAPETIQGRGRLFDPDDMIAVCLFRDLLDEGLGANYAGHIACLVASAARQHPEARAISYVRTTAVSGGWTVNGMAVPAESLPAPETWNKAPFNGVDLIERVTTVNVWQIRERIKQRTEEEMSIVGEND